MAYYVIGLVVAARWMFPPGWFGPKSAMRPHVPIHTLGTGSSLRCPGIKGVYCCANAIGRPQCCARNREYAGSILWRGGRAS